MLDPIIRNHVKEQDKIEEGLRAEIDKLYENINIDVGGKVIPVAEGFWG